MREACAYSIFLQIDIRFCVLRFALSCFYHQLILEAFDQPISCSVSSLLPGYSVGPRWAPSWPHEPCYQGSCTLPMVTSSFPTAQCNSPRGGSPTIMMTSSHGNALHTIGPLCEKSTNFHHKGTVIQSLGMTFFLTNSMPYKLKKNDERTVELSLIWNMMPLVWRRCNGIGKLKYSSIVTST